MGSNDGNENPTPLPDLYPDNHLLIWDSVWDDDAGEYVKSSVVAAGTVE